MQPPPESSNFVQGTKSARLPDARHRNKFTHPDTPVPDSHLAPGTAVVRKQKPRHLAVPGFCMTACKFVPHTTAVPALTSGKCPCSVKPIRFVRIHKTARPVLFVGRGIHKIKQPEFVPVVTIDPLRMAVIRKEKKYRLPVLFVCRIRIKPEPPFRPGPVKNPLVKIGSSHKKRMTAVLYHAVIVLRSGFGERKGDQRPQSEWSNRPERRWKISCRTDSSSVYAPRQGPRPVPVGAFSLPP